MLYVAKGLLVMVITWYCTKLIVTLQSHFTRHPFFGNRCMLDEPSNQTTVLNTARAQCVWRCLSREDCKVVSYNHRLNSCDLSMQLCDTVAFAANFSIIVYGIHRPLCSRWVPKSEFDEALASTPENINVLVHSLSSLQTMRAHLSRTTVVRYS